MIQRTLMIVLATAFLAVAQEAKEPKCNCAVFKSPMPDKTSETPLIMKNPNFPIDCNATGKETCAKMCIALAEAAKDKAPKVLCEAIGNTTTPFSPLVYSKSCGDQMWTNTGLTSKFQVCCANKLPVPCPESQSQAVRGSEQTQRSQNPQYPLRSAEA